MIRRRIHMLEIAKFYQRMNNREAERQRAEKEKPKSLLGRLLKK